MALDDRTAVRGAYLISHMHMKGTGHGTTGQWKFTGAGTVVWGGEGRNVGGGGWMVWRGLRPRGPGGWEGPRPSVSSWQRVVRLACCTFSATYSGWYAASCGGEGVGAQGRGLGQATTEGRPCA